MKVFVICGSGIVSGKEIMSLRLLEGLKEKGHECICITAYWGSKVFSDRLTQLGIRYHVMRLGFISKTLKWNAIWWTLHQLIHVPGLWISFVRTMRKEKPDIVVHTNFHHVFLLLPFLTSRSRNVYWTHEIMPLSNFYRKLFNRFNKRMQRFIAVSNASSKPLIEFVGAGKVIVVKNGINIQVVTRKERPDNDPLTLAIVGQVAAHKGHEVLFRALHLLGPRTRNLRLAVVGVGPVEYLDHLKKLAVELGFDQIVEWRGFQKKVEDIYSGVDIAVIPSIIPESYPTTIMECGFFGIPVIASAIGGIPEMIAEGVNGYTFQTGDVNGLARVLGVVIESDLSPMSRKTKAHADLNFSGHKFIQEFERALLSEIGDKG